MLISSCNGFLERVDQRWLRRGRASAGPLLEDQMTLGRAYAPCISSWDIEGYDIWPQFYGSFDPSGRACGMRTGLFNCSTTHSSRI